MANSTATRRSDPMPFFNPRQEPAEAAAAVQKELLEAYRQAGRAWLARVQSEVALWSELAFRLNDVRSVPDAAEARAKCASQQMPVTAEDGQRLLSDCQHIAQEITSSLGPAWPPDLSKLILKLRWIGMEEEALRLELVARTLPAEQRGTVSAGPFSTD